MLRRMLVLFVLSILVVALSGLVLAEQGFEIQRVKSVWDPPTEIGSPDDEGDDDNNGLGFGTKIAGTWLGTGEFGFDGDCDGVADCPPDPDPEDPPCPTPFPYDSQSFSASGLYIATNPNDVNLGHGTWKKTGRREVTTNNIVYVHDPSLFNVNEVDVDGVGVVAPGAVSWIMRIPGVFTFDSEFMTATSTFRGYGYAVGQNPLDPTVAPTWCTVGQHFLLQKVTVTP